MKIAIYGINYAPELTGIGKYTAEMCEWLAAKGHNVTVYTGMPYYPEWQVHPEYRRRRWWLSEVRNNVKVNRSPLYVPKKLTSLKRILLEISYFFGLMPMWLGSLFRRKYDVVISVTPPFHVGIFPLLYCKIRGAKFITHVQDLQIDAAKNLNMINNSKLLDAMFKMETYLFSKSDLVTTISKGMRLQIQNKNIPGSKIDLFPNWVDVNFIHPTLKKDAVLAKYGLRRTDRVVLYSGNLGEKQGLELIPQVAALVKDRPEIKFLIVGSGGNKETLEKLTDSLQLTNVHFFPLAEYSELPDLLAIADVHLILQKKSASDLVLPSKLTGILAAGGCALVTAEKETSLFEIITDNNIGFIAEPENKESVKDGILKILASDITGMKERARQYAVSNLSQDGVMGNFERILIRLTSDNLQARTSEAAA